MNMKNNLFKLSLIMLFGICSFTIFAENSVGENGDGLADCGASTNQSLSREGKSPSSDEENTQGDKGSEATER